MKRATLCAILVGTTATACLGQSYQYSFDGTLSDHFDPLLPNPNALIGQNLGAEQLEFSTPVGNMHPENSTGQLSTQFRPRYDQSWIASVDITLPAGYDTSFLLNNPDNPGEDTWLEVGMLAGFDFANNFIAFSSVLELVPNFESTEVLRYFGMVSDTVDLHQPTAESTFRVTIEFDANTKLLTGSSPGFVSSSTDIGPTGENWGMTDSDVFDVVLFGSTGYQAVSGADPLIHDNFLAAIVPEPTSLLLLLAGLLACLGRHRTA